MWSTLSLSQFKLTCLVWRPVPSTPEVRQAEGRPLLSEFRVKLCEGGVGGLSSPVESLLVLVESLLALVESFLGSVESLLG